MKCDTCQRDTETVLRVMIASGYNRALARPLYNCSECFEKKEQAKRAGGGSERPGERAPRPG